LDVSEPNDKYACAELIQAWGLYRDQGKWSELLATFVPDGQIAVSWFSGDFGEFVDRCRQGFQAGQRSKHHIFPSVVRLAGQRALAETNIVILVRQKIGGVLADMTSYARFLDRLERASGACRRISTGYCRPPTSPPIRKLTATWRRGSLLPAARLLPSSIATARRTRRNYICAMTPGSTENSVSKLRNYPRSALA
jgi:hypothetical protein